MYFLTLLTTRLSANGKPIPLAVLLTDQSPVVIEVIRSYKYQRESSTG